MPRPTAEEHVSSDLHAHPFMRVANMLHTLQQEFARFQCLTVPGTHALLT